MRSFFEDMSSEAVLLLDAENAFNRVNRKAALWNIQFVCPILKYTLINTYRVPARIFVLGGFELLSQEGTTQGCPFGMIMYALALVPLLRILKPICNQVWYADDGSGCGSLLKLREWWDATVRYGPSYGYFPRASKTWLIVKAEKLDLAKRIFSGTQVQITSQGKKHLGASLGSSGFRENYLRQKIDNWIDSVERLSKIAVTQPHAAYAAFTHGLQARWSYVLRTIPDSRSIFESLEEVIRLKFIPSLLGREVSDLERKLLSLPARFAGMGIFDPSVDGEEAFGRSENLTEPLVHLISSQAVSFDPEKLRTTQRSIRKGQKEASNAKWELMLADIEKESSPSLKLAIAIGKQKGASNWLTSIPRTTHGTVLHKGDFRDAIYLRYGWTLPNLFEKCVCGTNFTVEHAFSCMRGGFRGMLHNEVSNVFMNAFIEAGFKSVGDEPGLQALSGEVFDQKSVNKSDEARSDIKVLGFWTRMRHAFFDVTAISPFARSNLGKSLESMLRSAESRKVREYRARILQVEHADFNPLVFSVCGGMGAQASVVLKRICQCISEKQNLHYSIVAGFMRVRISFALLRSALICLRGTRSKTRSLNMQIDLAVSEAKMHY